MPPDTPRTPQSDAAILTQITASLAQSNDLEPLLGRLLSPIVRLAGAQAAAVRVLSDGGDRLRLVSSIGLPADLCGSDPTVDRHCGHCGAAADAQQLVWAQNLDVCAARSGHAYFAPPGLRLLAVPLQHRGQTLGVYSLFFSGAGEPAADVMTILRSIGELLGLALHNARLEQVHLHAQLASERQMMAAEVHDSLAQSLAFVRMRLPLLHDAMLAHDDARAAQYFDDVGQAVRQAHLSLRGILTHFRSPMDPQGLLHALAASADNFRRNTGAELELVNDVPQLQLPPDCEAQVFHIVQEALTNVARHASARHASVHVSTAGSGRLQIVVEDDGAGLPPAATACGLHYGMEIMAERARRLGGTLEVGARLGGGTRVCLAFPVAGLPPPAGAGAC